MPDDNEEIVIARFGGRRMLDAVRKVVALAASPQEG
jgi:hypothetical protein